MRRHLPQSKELIAAFILGSGISLFAQPAEAQDTATDTAAEPTSQLPPPNYVVPAPRTITATLPPKAPEKLVELYWHDEAGHICVDAFRLSVGQTTILRNTPVTARVRISRKCDDRTLNAPTPISATMSTRAGQKSGPSQTIKPDGTSFAFNLTFPYAGQWQITVVSKYDGGENYTVSVPVKVLAERPTSTK